MKTIGKIIAAAIGALCFVLVSCSKEEGNPYSGSFWSGTYPVRTLNGTTGETEDQTGVCALTFCKGANQCSLAFGLEGLYGTTCTNYEVRWSDNTHFALYTSGGDQTLVCYSGAISKGRMSLQAFNCDGVAATYELSRIMLE